MPPNNRESGISGSGEVSSQEHSLLNCRIGNFTVERFLAEGAMGKVYLGVHDTLDRKVAIKVLKAELSQEQRLVDRFIDEAQIVSGLGHPGIAQITDFGRTDGGQFYAVMEYLEGMDASQAQERDGPMRPGRVASIGVQAAAALAVVHDRDIVHRDLKPANIFLVLDETGIERVKVLDFGIAKLRDPAKDRSRTSEGAIVGTPDYMAPEQAETQALVTDKADIYGLGCVMYELLCGHPPFDADSILALLLAHRSEKPKDLDRLVTTLPIGLSAVIMRCLEKKPGDRWQSARDLRTALLPFATDLPEGLNASRATHTQVIDVVKTRSSAPRVVLLLILLAASGAFYFSRQMGHAPSQGAAVTDLKSPGLMVFDASVPDARAVVDATVKDALDASVTSSGNPFGMDSDLVVAEGAAIFASACAECHGVSGEGNGHKARVDTIPRAFSHLSIAAGMLDNYRFGVVQRGITSKMPPFQDSLSENDIWKVVTFISTLSADTEQAPMDELWQLKAPRMTSKMVKQGKRLFAQECRGCHGDIGEGDGPASAYLGRRPANLRKGTYKLRTTYRESVPTSSDIYRTLSQGMGVSGMPSFSKLPARARWQLVAFLQSLSPRFRKQRRVVGIAIPEAPAASETSVHRGRANYLAAGCAKCHGDAGLGDGELAVELVSNSGDSILPANFSVPSTFIGGSTPRELYRTMMTGIAGTPMPAGEDFFDEGEAWDVIAYILSLEAKHTD